MQSACGSSLESWLRHHYVYDIFLEGNEYSAIFLVFRPFAEYMAGWILNVSCQVTLVNCTHMKLNTL